MKWTPNGIGHEVARIAINLHAPVVNDGHVRLNVNRTDNGYVVELNQMTFLVEEDVLSLPIREAQLRIQEAVLAQLYPNGL